ncbi:alpha/beta hydrolase [Alterisphingorhabdus coralli]|uniref:Alpha/beta hydrolase n=1 Tax=Alterisphingorhabdus coralli TaxID=3071408 RepID=A0AA97F5H2_9SPHN|nr:alpha/beta hydrolase [Parasphingorhabdus sp. SCSIO 66989]WOE74679.1 alpha/beta hydrolase [Parasphingorhabdus sp. SCSIO 66989]
MSPDLLNPEIRDAIARLPRLPFASRIFLPLARMAYNVASRSPLMDGVRVEKVSSGDVEMLAYTNKAKASRAAVLWFYGGGFLAGKPEHLNALASMIALHSGASVFVPTYRLAPKHPFPAALEDSQRAWRWLLEEGPGIGIDTERLAVGGNSAGGGLAASLVQWISDESDVQPRSQILFYPMLDDRVAADQSLDRINHFIWNNRANRVAWNAYLSPHKVGAAQLPPYASAARRDDLGGLPPTWIGQCALDLFCQEDGDYAQRLIAAGVDCKLEQVEGVPHAFEVIQPDASISKAFTRSAVDFLAESLN